MPSRGLRWQTPFQKIQSVMNILPLPNQKVDGKISHSRLGHAGINAVGRLPKEVNEAVVKDTMTVKGETHAVSKAHKEISKRTPNKVADQGITMESSALNTLQQNGPAKHSGGVVIPKEELDEKPKEETDETSEDETQMDIGGSRQVVPNGNRGELNRQDDDLISPQASKDDYLPGLPTPESTP